MLGKACGSGEVPEYLKTHSLGGFERGLHAARCKGRMLAAEEKSLVGPRELARHGDLPGAENRPRTRGMRVSLPGMHGRYFKGSFCGGS